MPIEDHITVADLKQLMRYEPDTGKLYWLERGPQWFHDTEKKTSAQLCKWWNARYAGREAFTAINSEGYRQGTVLGFSARASRVIFAIANEEWPTEQVDHENGDRTDDRIKNLRQVTNLENSRNAARPKNNTSGFTGIAWDESRGKWKACITVRYKIKFLGRFTDINDAIAARKAAEAKHGFHPNHDRVAPVSD